MLAQYKTNDYICHEILILINYLKQQKKNTMNATRTILMLLFAAFAATMSAQSASEFAAKYKGQEGINYQELTPMISDAKKRFDDMAANPPAVGQMPEGMPTIEQFKQFFDCIATVEVIMSADGAKSHAMSEAVKAMKNYVPLIIYTDEVEQPTLIDCPDNVRRIQMPANPWSNESTYQAYGLVDNKDAITNLIIVSRFQQFGSATCVTGRFTADDIPMFYGIQRMTQMMRHPRP